VTEDASRAEWLQQARSYLRNANPVLARLIDDRPAFDPRAWMGQLPPMDLYGALLFQVTGQQLSVPATRRTLARLEALFGGHLPAPAELLRVDPAMLREAGLSWRKVSTLRDLAVRLTDGRLSLDVLSSLPDEELMAELTAIPGIGPWTVQGALIIALQREDVVLPGDLALPKAIQAAYQLGHLPTSRRSLPSRRTGGPIAAWRPATCFSPPLSRTRHHGLSRLRGRAVLHHDRRVLLTPWELDSIRQGVRPARVPSRSDFRLVRGSCVAIGSLGRAPAPEVVRCRSAQRLICSRAGSSALPASVRVYVTDTGGPASTVRATSPASVSSLRRSDRTESLMPGTARASARKPTGPPLSVPSSTPVQRLPNRSKARTSEASAATQSVPRAVGAVLWATMEQH
jgi:DNA-3-methyladenine glycosylase II